MAPIFAVSQDANTLSEKRSWKAAGGTHVVIQAGWDQMQLSAWATPTTQKATELKQQFADAATAGLRVWFEFAHQYPPSWFTSGVPQYKDQFGNSYSGGGGENIRDVVWTQIGLNYFMDFMSKTWAVLSTSEKAQIDTIRVGFGYYGETSFPPVGGSHPYPYWGFSTAAQTGVGLASDQVVCPVPRHAPFGSTPLGTTANANDAAFVTWYRDSATIRMRSQVDHIRSLGYRGLIHVLLPSTGLRPNWSSADGNYREQNAKGCDWSHQMNSFMQVADVYPWCTWLEQGDFTTPVTQESHKAPWRFMRDLAIAKGRSTYMWGENAAGATNTGMNNMFTTGALANGYTGLLWVDWSSLNSGGGGTLANLQSNIAAYTRRGGGGSVTLAGVTSTSANGTSITGTKPAGTTTGDLLIAIHSNDDGTDSLPPNPAWTDITQVNLGTGVVRLKAYRADGGVASTRFENLVACDCALTLLRITGVAGTPGLVSATNNGVAGTSTSHVAPSVTPTTGTDLLICAASSSGGGVGITWTPPGGMTERSDLNSGNWNGHTVATQVLSSSATGTKTFTASRADRWTTLTIAVSP